MGWADGISKSLEISCPDEGAKAETLPAATPLDPERAGQAPVACRLCRADFARPTLQHGMAMPPPRLLIALPGLLHLSSLIAPSISNSRPNGSRDPVLKPEQIRLWPASRLAAGMLSLMQWILAGRCVRNCCRDGAADEWLSQETSQSTFHANTSVAVLLVATRLAGMKAPVLTNS